MRGLSPAASRRAPVLAALTLGAVAGCFHEDFLLGAYCVRDADCGDTQCCEGVRCRPSAECKRGLGSTLPFAPAYTPCNTDETCLAHGLPHCAFWDDADLGFCTDLCVGDPLVNCERHAFLYTSRNALPRTCVTIDDQSMCALDCAEDGVCPPDMACRTGVCVPTKP